MSWIKLNWLLINAGWFHLIDAGMPWLTNNCLLGCWIGCIDFIDSFNFIIDWIHSIKNSINENRINQKSIQQPIIELGIISDPIRHAALSWLFNSFWLDSIKLNKLNWISVWFKFVWFNNSQKWISQHAAIRFRSN